MFREAPRSAPRSGPPPTPTPSSTPSSTPSPSPSPAPKQVPAPAASPPKQASAKSSTNKNIDNSEKMIIDRPLPEWKEKYELNRKQHIKSIFELTRNTWKKLIKYNISEEKGKFA